MVQLGIRSETADDKRIVPRDRIDIYAVSQPAKSNVDRHRAFDQVITV